MGAGRIFGKSVVKVVGIAAVAVVFCVGCSEKSDDEDGDGVGGGEGGGGGGGGGGSYTYTGPIKENR